jgi:hypothetical protein
MTVVLEQLQTWEAMAVALLGAGLWALPIKGRWPLWHHSIGLWLVALVGAVSAVRARDLAAFAPGALQGMLGLSVSWLLIEAVVIGRAIGRRVSQSPKTERPPTGLP